MNEKAFLKTVMESITPKRKSDIVLNTYCMNDSFISVTVATTELFFELVEKSEPYITNNCYYWLTDFGKNTVPRHFPHSTYLHINELYDRDEILFYLKKEFEQK